MAQHYSREIFGVLLSENARIRSLSDREVVGEDGARGVEMR